MATRKDPLAVEVGLRLRCARTRRGFEVMQVADALGIEHGTIRTWENGFSFPPYAKLLKMCRLYHCSVEEIIVGEVPDSWEGVAALMPVDLREKTLIINSRPAVSSLVSALNNMTDEQLARLEGLIPQLTLVGDAGMPSVEKILTGLAGLIGSTARRASIHATGRQLKVCSV